ncbi:MAG: hypothetical protein JJU02_15680 [Cryomorphaceae bacterium]|nr:hypothetical protein [Cryomorphaceae bacterium]
MRRYLHKIKNKPALSRWLFYLCLAGLVFPIYLLPLFPTLDGAAHLYGASLIARWNEFSFAHEVFLKHPFPPPNILSHWLMAAVWSFASPAGIEKGLVMLIIILPAIGAEIICRQKGISSVNALLILPLSHNLMLYMGFYNFLLGIGIMILAYAVLHYLRGKSTWMIVMYTLAVAILMHFSHLFILPFFTGILLIDFLFSKSRLKRIALISSLLPLAASFIVFFMFNVEKSSSSYQFIFPETLQRLAELWDAKPLVTFRETETIRTQWFTILLIVLLFTELWRIKRWSYSGRAFGVISAALLIIFLFTPDALFGGGFLSVRVHLFLLVSLVLLLILEVRRIWQRIAIILFFFIYTPLQYEYQYKISKYLSHLGSQLYHLGEQMQTPGIALPVYNIENWLEQNVANYAGVHNPILIADFYEALNPHFPFYYNHYMHLYRMMGLDEEGGNDCPDIQAMESKSSFKIEYIINIRHKTFAEDCPLSEMIETEFTKIGETIDCTLYQRIK